jgi:6-phospho-beta-glucosidase
MGVKVAVVGAGSTYTPELVEGFARRAGSFPMDELALLDIDPERLDIVGSLAGRMLARAGWSGKLRPTQDRLEAIEGADYVIVQLRVGGQAARYVDETLPLRFGCIGTSRIRPGS